MTSLAEMAAYTGKRIMENYGERIVMIIFVSAATTFYLVGLPDYSAWMVASGTAGLLFVEGTRVVIDKQQNNQRVDNVSVQDPSQ